MAVQFAKRLALVAFATESIHGVIAGSDFQATLQTALVALVLLFVLGFLCGEVARRVVEESVQFQFTASDQQQDPSATRNS